MTEPEVVRVEMTGTLVSEFDAGNAIIELEDREIWVRADEWSRIDGGDE